MPACLVEIHRQIDELIRVHRPEVCAGDPEPHRNTETDAADALAIGLTHFQMHSSPLVVHQAIRPI